jgi:hypothetical protein
VQRLDRPLLPDVTGQGDGVCPAGFRAGDAERGDVGDGFARQVGDVPFDEERLADVRERQVVGAGRTWMVRVVTRPWPLSVAV